MKFQHGLRITAITAAFFLALTVTGCNKNAEDSKKTAKAAEIKSVFAVTTTTATQGELKEYLEFGGDVTAKVSVDITPDTTGKIAEVRIRVGDTVEKNQIIALVDPSRPGMNYELSPVKSQISGTITAVNTVVGAIASPQLSIAKVSKIENLEITMNVPERYISKIRMDQYAYLKFDAYPGETFLARISEISPVLDPSSRTMTVKLVPEEKKQKIKTGMFARIKLITETITNTVKIPESAVVNRFGETFVFIVSEKTLEAEEGEEPKTEIIVKKQNVTVGIRVDDKIEILNGLKKDDEVVVRGQTLLEDGSYINIVSRIAPLSEMENTK